MKTSSRLAKQYCQYFVRYFVPPQCPADIMVCCFLQDVVIAQKGMALIAAAANQVAAFPEVGNPMAHIQASLDSAACLL